MPTSQGRALRHTAVSVKCCSKNISEIMACSSGSASICASSACSTGALSMSSCARARSGHKSQIRLEQAAEPRNDMKVCAMRCASNLV